MLLPLLLIGIGVAYLSGRRHGEVHVSVPQKTIASGVPSPLVVLDAFLREGRRPPPQVILCAIAQAEIMGRIDVANELVRAFVAPVVERSERRGAVLRRASRAPASYDYDVPIPRGEDEDEEDYEEDLDAAPPAPARAPARAPISPGGRQSATAPGTDPTREAIPGRGEPRPIARAEDARVEILPRQEPILARASPTEGTVTVSGRSSPIDGVGTEEWSRFASRVARELPTFTTSHHVGQFRQRRDRLADLGIDASKIVNSPEAQAAALDADMADAYGHALRSGMIADYCGTSVSIPGQSAPIGITLSGVLGVIQAAGLEGATGWLEDPRDRKQFPHTTQAFLRTNGVF